MFRYSLMTIGSLLLVVGLISVTACRSLPNSGLDPYGERLFSKGPLQGAFQGDCNLFGRSKSAQTTAAPATTTGASVYQPAAPTVLGSNGTLPGGLDAYTNQNTASAFGSTVTPLPSGGRGINTAIIPSPDSVKQVFAETGGYALPTEPITGPYLLMTPREQIAPVGSEVVLIASYLGSKGYLITNEKIDWTLEGSGSFQNFDQGHCCDVLRADFVHAKKMNERYVITKTSSKLQTIDRGTADTNDDLHLLRGQTWVSVNSMKEGTTVISAHAPGQKDWSKRTDFGIIHWVDAQWVLPSTPIAPVGESRVLTTTILRRTNGQPRAGWIVRYEVLSGPRAGFGQSLAQIEEVATDYAGQASIVLKQLEPQQGTNTIAIRIIRPAGVDGGAERVTVGNEQLRQTWAGSAGIIFDIRAPQNVSRGDEIPYTISVVNQTNSVANGVVTMSIPPAAEYVRSEGARLQGDTAVWQNVTIPPNGKTALSIVIRAVRAGQLAPVVHFYPQGTPLPPTSESIYSSTTLSGSSVPMPPATTYSPSGQGSIATPPTAPFDPANQVPNLPSGSGASRFHPGSPDAASRIVSVDLSIVPLIDFSPNHKDAKPILLGSHCAVCLVAKNNAALPIEKAVLRLSIVEYIDRYPGRIHEIRGTDGANIDEAAKEVYFPVAQIPAGGTVSLQVELPTIDARGYRFTGKLVVDGQTIKDVTQTILPR